MEVRLNELLPSQGIKKIHTLIIPYRYIDQKGIFVKILALICNYYEVDTLHVSPHFLNNVSPGPWLEYFGYHRDDGKILFAKTVRNLVITAPVLRHVRYILEKFPIEKVTFIEQDSDIKLSSSLNRMIRERKNMISTGCRNNKLKFIREIVFVYGSHSLSQTEVHNLDNLINRNRRRQGASTLMGIVKFRKIPGLLGKDVVKIIAKMVWQIK
jgi:hypothetical protein